MDRIEEEFLLKEFDTAWQQVMSFDSRRGAFFNIFNVAFIAVISISSGVWAREGVQSILATMALTVLYSMLFVISCVVMKVLESEREANLRYRRKINLIRSIFLSGSGDGRVKNYLTRKDIGIKVADCGDSDLDKVGGTLRYIYRLIHIEQFALILLISGIWLAYSWDSVMMLARQAGL